MLLSFFGLAGVISSAWLTTGATKYTAQYNKENNQQAVREVCSFSIGLTAVISVAITTVLILFNGFVAGNAAGLLINFLFLQRHIGLVLARRVLLLMAIALMAFVGYIALRNIFWGIRTTWVAIVIILIGATLKREEWVKIYRYVMCR